MLAERAQRTVRSMGCQGRLTGVADDRIRPGASEIRGRNELIGRDGEGEEREKKEERKRKEREKGKRKKCSGFSGLKTRFYIRNGKRNFNYFLEKF